MLSKIILLTVSQLNRAFTFGVQAAKDQHLVTTGMYRLVRNPAYSGSILSLLGIGLALRSILSVIEVLIVCLVCYRIRIHTEEKELTAAFDEEFSSYCTHTKRLVPFIW
jgi:protein-S-isoprenylcysteine O-methyltransferase Ste14